MKTITISTEEATRVLNLLRTVHMGMGELADAFPDGAAESYDLLTASMAGEVNECVNLIEASLHEAGALGIPPRSQISSRYYPDTDDLDDRRGVFL